MAVKVSTLDSPKGPNLWRYVPAFAPTAPGGQNFPGIQSADACGGEAGDTLIITSVRPLASGGDFGPDETGLRPHLAIYPGSNQVADPNHVARGNYGQEDKLTAIPGWPWGNDENPACLRVDLGTVYLRWGCGSIQVEGGSGPGGDEGTLIITYLWDRPKILRDRAGWSLVVPPPITHRLTLYSLPRLRTIDRPAGATRIWTPDATIIRGNTGTSSVNFPFNGTTSLPLPVGPCDSFVTNDATSLLVFELDL